MIDISGKKKLCSTAALFFVVRVVLVNTYKIYKRFYDFQRDFEILKLQYINLLCVLPLSEAYSEPSQTCEMELFAERS